MLISRRIMDQSRVLGRITIECRMNVLQQNWMHYFRITGFIFLGTFFSALLLSLRLQRIISEPLKRITRAAQRVSQGEDFQIDIVHVGHDEIGMLVESFTHMVAQIQEREEELRKHRNHLEELVDKRSALIKQTNDELRKEVWERKRAQHALVRLNEELEDHVNARTRELQLNIEEVETV